MAELKVVPIGTNNLRDIPAMLRNLANDIEKVEGNYADIAGVVTVVRFNDYRVMVFGHGEENYDTSIVALELGKMALLKMSPV